MTTITKRYGLHCDVLRPAHGVSCTQGASARGSDALLVDVAGGPFTKEDAEKLACSVFYLHRKRSMRSGGEYLYAAPIEGETIGRYMFGGNFLWSSDGRFPNDYPIPVHDRTE